MGLTFLVWVGGGRLKRVLYIFGNEPSLGRKSLILHLPQKLPLKPQANASFRSSAQQFFASPLVA